VLAEIFAKETAKIEQAGKYLAETLKQDGIRYVFGCGHGEDKQLS